MTDRDEAGSPISVISNAWSLLNSIYSDAAWREKSSLLSQYALTWCLATNRRLDAESDLGKFCIRNVWLFTSGC
jgi:hypothetical protein